MDGYYHCSGCGLVIGRNGKPVEEYPRVHTVFAVMYLCEMCRSQGKTFDTPIKQTIPEYYKNKKDDNGDKGDTSPSKPLRLTVDDLSVELENAVLELNDTKLTWVKPCDENVEISEATNKKA